MTGLNACDQRAVERLLERSERSRDAGNLDSAIDYLLAAVWSLLPPHESGTPAAADTPIDLPQPAGGRYPDRDSTTR